MIRYSLFGTAGQQPSAEQARLPITLFRWGWGTLILLRRRLIPSGTIGFASDIRQDIYPIAGIHPSGSAAYDSGGFGWLEGTRRARLYKLTPWTEEEVSSNIAGIFRKAPHTFPDGTQFRLLPDLIGLSPDDCLFYENGEKEYSCEITTVWDASADLLLRYTVDGSNWGDGTESVGNFQRLQSQGSGS